MADYEITKATARKTLSEAISGLEDGKTYDVSINERSIGKWSLSRLWRAWMSDISKWMADNGATMPLVVAANGRFAGSRQFNADDCHEMFTVMTLGTDKDGHRLSWSKAGRDGSRPASKGERLLAMQRVEAWASERGIKLMNPRDSEYHNLNQD